MQEPSEVQFKVFVHWNEQDYPEVRRFNLLTENCEDFVFLCTKLAEIYPDIKGKTFTITWKDVDQDDVVISSSQELITALRYVDYKLLKLYAFVDDVPVLMKKENCNIYFGTNAGAGFTANLGALPVGLHLGVECDSCGGSVIGFRYKCSVCPDFDQCAKCETAGRHSEHCMVRVPTQNMPRTQLKSALKKSRIFLKTVTKTALPDDCQPPCIFHPATKRRRSRSAEKKPRHGGEHHRHARSSWLDTFATYVNEFVNVAGDVVAQDEAKTKAKAKAQPKPKEQQPQTQEKAQSASANASAAPNQPEPGTSANAQTQCPFLPGNIDIANVQGLLNVFLRDLQAVNTDVGQGDRKNSEPDVNAEAAKSAEASVKSDASVKSGASSINNDFAKDGSPEKVDGWTLINKEKDMDAANNAADPAPIGFNLPQEFQRIKINDGGNLYPPLNTSTAVMDPKVPEERPAAVDGAAAAAPSAPEQPQVAPQAKAPKPRSRHSKAHIEAALNQMLGMGFTNDGGWLTQLLELKDGNIAAVLDLLTPVTKK